MQSCDFEGGEKHKYSALITKYLIFEYGGSVIDGEVSGVGIPVAILGEVVDNQLTIGLH